MPFTPWFPEPGSYIRYYDVVSKTIKYRKLIWRRDPYTYPRRLVSVSAGSKGDSLNLTELNPSETKKHIYLAYLGVKPGFLFYFWHPYDIKGLKWDEDIVIISDDLTAVITYESSPYEFPTKSFAIERDRYPAIQAKNISGETKHPEVVVVAAMYVIKEQAELSGDELNRLQSGALRSHPWDFGGEM